MKTTGADTTINFVEPMYALAVQNISEGKEWLFEVKFDGYRCLAGRGKNGVTLWSRRGNVFTSQFPHIARACERLPNDTLLDGEIVASIGTRRSGSPQIPFARSLDAVWGECRSFQPTGVGAGKFSLRSRSLLFNKN